MTGGQRDGTTGPARVLRARLHDQPRVRIYLLARPDVAARLVADAATAGTGDTVTDIGALPVRIGSPGAKLIQIGVRHRAKWLSVTEGCERIAAAVTDLEHGQN